ncbi:MAG: aspartate kinase [Bacteroidia bacterium]|nr:aspartate kinase [Bacteroidia bacterium]
MRVMKFGGASVKNAEAIRNVGQILENFRDEALLIVVSAMDKTTNHLENLAFLARDGKKEAAFEQFKKIKRFHLGQVEELFRNGHKEEVKAKVMIHIDTVEKILNGILQLEEFPPSVYDRIVSHGEVLSTVLVSEYLKDCGRDCIWLEASKLIKTDANFKQAGVIWSLTEDNIQEKVKPLMQGGRVIVTQGFIGSTTNGKVTTLGREGSDYTGSIFAYCLDAENLTVWKDVKGILNGDPRIRPDAIKHNELTYEEAVEMTFYGASVIHPKTIKPIYSKDIPLLVKCFTDVNESGTVISTKSQPSQIPSYIIKKKQAVLTIKPKDFSFMEERLMNHVFEMVYKSGVKVNLVQNSAISLSLCIDDVPSRRSNLTSMLLDDFTVEEFLDLKLYTVLKYKLMNLKDAADALMVQQQGQNLFYVK